MFWLTGSNVLTSTNGSSRSDTLMRKAASYVKRRARASEEIRNPGTTMQFRFTEAPSSRILHEASYRVFDERVDFCLALDKICVLIRRLVRQDGATFSQVLEAESDSLFELAWILAWMPTARACFSIRQ